MITSIDFKNIETSASFKYAKDLEFFAAKKKLTFKPGLNILFGPNGCGKSTILSMLARSLCAEQGGASTVTQEALLAISGRHGEPVDQVGLTIKHDGQPILYADTRRAVGVVSGHFDEDFFLEGLQETLSSRGSSGETAIRRLTPILETIAGKRPPPKAFVHKIKRNALNDAWKQKWDVLEARLAPAGKKGPFTIVLDEPEANMSMTNQRDVWSFINKSAVENNIQVIASTHSPFALNLLNATYVDMVPGYLEACRAAVKALSA